MDLQGIQGWINGAPVESLEDLRGKVVLLDFWTYSCVNCIRTLPYLRAWNEEYADKGLVIIGVHSPEFAFEKSRANVERAVQDLDVPWLVALDSDHATWDAFNVRAWPTKVLIGADGRERRRTIGEGRYEAQNFDNSLVDFSAVIWDFALQRSNYTDLRAAALTDAAWLTSYARPDAFLSEREDPLTMGPLRYEVGTATAKSIGEAYVRQGIANGDDGTLGCLDALESAPSSSGVSRACVPDASTMSSSSVKPSERARPRGPPPAKRVLRELAARTSCRSRDHRPRGCPSTCR